MALVPEFSEKTADIAKLLAHADDEQRKITPPVSDSKAAVNALVAMHLATATSAELTTSLARMIVGTQQLTIEVVAEHLQTTPKALRKRIGVG